MLFVGAAFISFCAFALASQTQLQPQIPAVVLAKITDKPQQRLQINLSKDYR